MLAIAACHQNPKSVENADVSTSTDTMAMKADTVKEIYSSHGG